VFLVDHTVTRWLHAKLTLGSRVVFVHTPTRYLLVLRLEAANGKPLRHLGACCWGCGASALMAAIHLD